jgi:cell wall-associated NlpC family hydrolase
MTKLLIGVVVAVALACLGLPVLLYAALTGAGPGACHSATTMDGSGAAAPAWTAEQLDIAATIVEVGITKSVPHWGWVVALATAMQESGLRNLPHLGETNDHDSIGVFQQRPSQGWGTPDQLADPAYQAGKFYDKLLTIAGWEQLPLTDAAQAVQRSAYPDAYAKWTTPAVTLVDTLANTAVNCTALALGQLPADYAIPANTPLAVVTAITWALAQLGTPYSFGGTCTDPHAGNPATQCDCSSLVQQAYAAAGIHIPRVTGDQVNAGTAVPTPDQLLPGDLILIPGALGTAAHPGHVGMYLGHGLIIHAPQTGDVVRITQLDGWLTDIAAIRRIGSGLHVGSQ